MTMRFVETQTRIWCCGTYVLSQATDKSLYEMWGIRRSSSDGTIVHRYWVSSFTALDKADEYLEKIQELVDEAGVRVWKST